MKKVIILLVLIFISCKTYKISDIENRYLLNDTGKNKYFLVEFIREKQLHNKLGEMPMITFNSEILICWDREIIMLDFAKKDIKCIDIIESDKGAGLFGSSGKFGVVRISTYKSKNCNFPKPK